MGDRITNESGTIINRSTLQNALNSSSVGRDAGDFLTQVGELVGKSGKQDAIDLFDQFNEELTKEHPRKSVLSTAWDGLVKILPAVATIAGASATIAKLFS